MAVLNEKLEISELQNLLIVLEDRDQAQEEELKVLRNKEKEYEYEQNHERHHGSRRASMASDDFVHRSCIQIHDGRNIVEVVITKASIERDIDLDPGVIDKEEVVIQHRTTAEAPQIMMNHLILLSAKVDQEAKADRTL